MTEQPVLQSALLGLVGRQLPRVLTQACRNPASPCHGCFDRNWWHYKIRDFPSIILQQGAYMLQCARDSGIAAQLGIGDTLELERAAINFWVRRALRHGAFEEYYPWEEGYPPLAFSTLAIAKMLVTQGEITNEVFPALHVAAKQLVSRFEGQAANQQVAGLAAVAWLRKLDPSLIQEADWQRLRDATLGLQTEEGWFEEYGGPDLGYLSVTVDCLWDIIDAEPDERCLDSIRSAVVWTHRFAAVTQGNIGMHNSRNTDYLVPYGFARTAAAGLPESGAALEILSKICTGIDSTSHPLTAVDDRYWSHYIGHSVVRALDAVTTSGLEFTPIAEPRAHSSDASGLHIVPLVADFTMLVSASKGGNVTIHGPDGHSAWCHFGWHLASNGKIGAMNWQSPQWTTIHADNCIAITGRFVEHKTFTVSPFRHAMLRLASFLLGPKLISVLKRVFIFKRGRLPWTIKREILWDQKQVTITDTILGTDRSTEIRSAPRSSSRHVSSADSYHIEDFMPVRGFSTRESKPGGAIQITTIVNLGSLPRVK